MSQPSADGIKSSKSSDRIRPKKVDSVQIAVEELERERRKLEEEKARLAAQKEQLNKRGSGKDRDSGVGVSVSGSITVQTSSDAVSEGNKPSFSDQGGTSSDDDGDAIASEQMTRKMKQRVLRPKKILKPRAVSASIRRIEALPPTDKDDFPEEWGQHFNLGSTQIEEEPADYIRPGECVALRIKLLDDKQVVKVRAAAFHRQVGTNGLLFRIKFQDSQLYLLVRLVSGDDKLEVVVPSEDSGLDNVIQSQDYMKNKTSAYYRPKAHSVYNTLGVLLEKDDIIVFVKIMQHSTQQTPESPQLPYRLLLQTLNNIDINEFSITRKIIVSDSPPKNRTLRKTTRRELVTFLREFDQRNVILQENLRQFEKMSKLSGKDPQPLLNDIYESIWASNRAITNRQNFNGKTVLHYVSGLGYSDTVKHTIKRLVMNDLNLLDVNMRTPLFYAVEAAHEDIVKDLLEAGATFHNKDIITETVSDLALRMGHFEILRMLNEAREKQEAANKAKGKRAGAAGPFSAKKVAAVSIHAAARADNVAALERAIADAKQESAKASILSPSQATPTSPALRAGMPAVGVDAVNEEGATGLHIAAASGNMKSLRVLLAAGANINAVDDAGATPLHQAVAAQKTECVEVLVDSGANLEAIDDTKSTPLNLAVSCNFEQIAKLLLAKGASINTVNERGFTPLHHACAFGYVEIARFLISKGADITAIAASDSSTPLHQAVFNGQHELITVLLEAGADLNQGDSKALHLACFNGHAMCVEILLANGANAGSVDAELSTPMHKAAYNGHSDCLKLLHAAGASVTAKDVEGATPLHKAAFSGKTDCVEFLLDSGASIDAIDSFEGTSLHNAAFQGHPETCALLLARGANILKVDDHKATVLHLAAISGRIETIKLLVEKGCPIDAIDDEGLSALMHAVRSIEAVSLLLKKGANVNFQDIKGRSALYLALLKHHDQSAKLLIEAGADPHQKDAKGVEPISLVSVEFKEIIMDAIKERQSLDDSSKLPKYEEAIKKFNNGGAKPTMEYLLNERLVENTPEDIARFFFKEAEALDGALLGEFLCHKNNADVLKAFCSRLNFEAQDLDQALRAYLQKFRLPGEAQQIDRCMEAFARRFFEQNPDIFPDSDTAYVLAFSLIMLNTDAHNPAILPEKKMTKEQFIRNNRGMWGPTHEDPPQELLEILYDNIVEDEIKFRDKKEPTERSGFLKRQGGRFSWQKCWFILKDLCLYYFKVPPKSDDEEPNGLIPLENVVVKVRDPKSNKFTLSPSAEGGVLKTAKKTKGKIVQGSAPELSFMVDTAAELDAWVKAIRAQVASNPFYELISKRTEEVTTQQRGREQLFGVGAVVDFKEFYDLALLCESCYGSELEIKKTYGTIAVAVIGQTAQNIKYFVMRNDDYKKQYVVVVGNLWTDRVKRSYEDEQPFDWREHIRLDATVDSIYMHIEPELKKEYTVTVAGHSAGAAIGAQFGLLLHQKQMKVAKIVAFGLPNIMTEKTATTFKSVNLVRVVDGMDPVDAIFPGNIHVGKQVIVLSKNYFCFENKFPELLASSDSPKLSKSGSTEKLSKNAKDSPREKDKDKDKKKDKDSLVVNPAAPRSAAKRQGSTGAEDVAKLKKKGQLDTRPHLIDSYLKRLKPKLKGPTENVAPKDILIYR